MLNKFEELENKMIVIKQVKSAVDATKKQQANLTGLGLRKIGSVSELKCTPDVYGMLVKVSHLITVNLK